MVYKVVFTIGITVEFETLTLEDSTKVILNVNKKKKYIKDNAYIVDLIFKSLSKGD